MKNVYIALENVRSLLNIGAIFRTCSFFGITNVLLVGYSGKDLNGKLHPKVKRASLGTENDLSITFFDSADGLLRFAKANNLSLVAVEQSNKSISFKQWLPQDNIILVFGNEIDGVSQEILDSTYKVIEIPRKGVHNSLNVTTTVGIILSRI